MDEINETNEPAGTNGGVGVDAGKLINFVRSEQERNRQATTTTWIVGGILLVIVAAYMTFILHSLRTLILDPTTLARVIAGNAEQAIPSQLEALEGAIGGQAPAVADTISRQVFATLPTLREQAEKQIDLVCDEMMPLLREEIRSMARTYMDIHRDDLKEHFADHADASLPQFFVDELFDETINSLNAELLARSGGRGVSHVSAATLTYLHDLNERLAELAAMPAETMSESERLQRRMIVSWVQIVNELISSEEAKSAKVLKLSPE